jgi:hypothetical protein
MCPETVAMRRVARHKIREINREPKTSSGINSKIGQIHRVQIWEVKQKQRLQDVILQEIEFCMDGLKTFRTVSLLFSPLFNSSKLRKQGQIKKPHLNQMISASNLRQDAYSVLRFLGCLVERCKGSPVTLLSGYDRQQ